MSGEKIKEILRDYGNPVYRFKAFYVNEALEELEQLIKERDELEERIDAQDAEISSNKYRVSRLLHIADENEKLKEDAENWNKLRKEVEHGDWYLGKGKYYPCMRGGEVDNKYEIEWVGIKEFLEEQE